MNEQIFLFGLLFGLLFGGIMGLFVGAMAEDAFDFLKVWDRRRKDDDDAL